ncbi:lysophospholipid acyltransferase family protein [Gramella sp. MT6]|uniref:lysophospholipid acyltransferase family protein n=2 Tax=unclassified Christiangramia TaxID=2615027 RepID=UPI001C6031FD|nr:lysophospholipid acyltransferase family protein [Gramella sp. MT6]QYA26171.1 lysophospholipid acyltransferase family protein [Gramella sp. MT6]
MKLTYIARLKFFPFYLISLLPMPILYFISDVLYIIVYKVVSYREKVVRYNLVNAFPERTGYEINIIEKKFYHHLCDIAVEAIKTLTISEKEIKKRLIIRNPELLLDFQKKHQSILMYAAHQGNWEWLVYLPIYFQIPSYTFYKPLKNGYFNELFLTIRERFGVKCIAAKKGYRTIIRQKNENLSVMNCIIGDQSPKRKQAKIWKEFMYRETAFLTGAEKIADRTGPAVVFPNFRKIKRGHYELQFHIVEKTETSSIIDNYIKLLESSIRKSPELWLWSHKRWKLSS